MAKQKRESGHYRVKYRETWTVGHYNAKSKLWYIIGNMHSFVSLEFDEIGKERITDLEN